MVADVASELRPAVVLALLQYECGRGAHVGRDRASIAIGDAAGKLDAGIGSDRRMKAWRKLAQILMTEDDTEIVLACLRE